MSIDFIDFVYNGVFLCLIGMVIVWLGLEERWIQGYHKGRDIVIFCCTKCSHIYALKGQEKTAPCPLCHFTNNRLHF